MLKFIVTALILNLLIWSILSVWREKSIRKEYHLLMLHDAYQRALFSNDPQAEQKFEQYKAVFNKYFMKQGGFMHMKLDIGMRFARFPAIWFHTLFLVVNLIVLYLALWKTW